MLYLFRILLVLGLLALVTAACQQATSTPTPTPTATPTATPTPLVLLTPSPHTNTDVDRSYSRRTPFVPLDNPQLLPAQEATYLPDDALVLGLEWDGEARAYPVRMLRFHHIVNDTVAGRPFLITY